MRSRHSLRARSLRVAVATAALYALLLQGFLGALLPAFATDAAYCAHSEGSGSDPAAGAHACCLVACRPTLGAPPAGAATPATRSATIVPIARPAAALRPIARPRVGLGARGPPAA